MLDIKRVTFPQMTSMSLCLPGFRSNLSIEQVVWEWQAADTEALRFNGTVANKQLHSLKSKM